MGSERKVVLVTRRTRLEDLLARYHTLSQARFYIEHLGADFSDYVSENAAYAQGLRVTVQALQAWGRYQVVDRSFLANFVFSADDIVVALGQDGLVANTMKYLDGQPLIGLNPEPARWDGLLLPFKPDELAAVLPDVASDKRPTRRVTMAQVTLSDGQRMRAVNDLFIGPRTHASALYELEIDGRKEAQSSSGVIVSTGLGSTAWMKERAHGRGVPRPAAAARTRRRP
jgi:NAD kinase